MQVSSDQRAPRTLRTWRSLFTTGLVAAMGCVSPIASETVASEVYDPEPVAGLSSGALCPSESLLSYDNFGRAFMHAYCSSCHSTAFAGSARRAPPDKNFDDPAAIRVHLRLIDQQAGAGPSAVHAVMPPEPPQPSLPARQQLSTWLACGAP